MLIRAARTGDTFVFTRLDTEASNLLQNDNIRASPPKGLRLPTTVGYDQYLPESRHGLRVQ